MDKLGPPKSQSVFFPPEEYSTGLTLISIPGSWAAQVPKSPHYHLVLPTKWSRTITLRSWWFHLRLKKSFLTVQVPLKQINGLPWKVTSEEHVTGMLLKGSNMRWNLRSIQSWDPGVPFAAVSPPPSEELSSTPRALDGCCRLDDRVPKQLNTWQKWVEG